MVEKTITIAIDADVQRFQKKMAQARASVSKTGKEFKEKTARMSKDIKGIGKSGGFKAFADSVKGLSPTFDNVAGTISDMGDRMKKAGKAGKLAMMGIKVAVGGLAVGIGVMLAKAVMDVTGKFAKLADPVRFDKATSEMRESIRTLKTSIGELASPVFEWMSKGVKALADGLNWVVVKMAQFVGFLQGLLGLGHKVNRTLKGTADGMDEAGASADAGLASFDKLNTLNVGEMGDMEQVESIAEKMEAMRKAGEDTAKSIRETFQPIYDLMNMDVGEIWVKFKDSAKEAWEGIKTWASEKWQEIKDKIKGTWDGMVQWASDAWENVKTKAKEIWDKISGWASDLWNGFTGWASDAWEHVKTKAHETWDDIKEWILGKFKAVGDAIKGIFDGVINAFKKAWNKVFGAIQGAIDWILGKIKWIMDKIEGIKNFFGNIGGKVKDFVGGKIEGVKNALGFAQGGLFQPNNPQLVMVGDNKTEPEVIAPKSMIKDAVREVVGEMGGMGGGSNVPITLTIDGHVLARYMYDDLESVSRQKGRRTIA